MKVTYRLRGQRAADSALSAMKAPARKAILRKTMKPAAEPVARSMRARVRVEEGDLRESVDVGERLSPTQRVRHRRAADFEMFVGPGPLPQAITEEFGTVHEAGHPFARPAWDAEGRATLDRFGAGLGIEIDRAAARAGKSKP